MCTQQSDGGRIRYASPGRTAISRSITPPSRPSTTLGAPPRPARRVVASSRATDSRVPSERAIASNRTSVAAAAAGPASSNQSREWQRRLGGEDRETGAQHAPEIAQDGADVEEDTAEALS
jgi:hypothetical protein